MNQYTFPLSVSAVEPTELLQFEQQVNQQLSYQNKSMLVGYALQEVFIPRNIWTQIAEVGCRSSKTMKAKQRARLVTLRWAVSLRGGE